MFSEVVARRRSISSYQFHNAISFLKLMWLLFITRNSAGRMRDSARRREYVKNAANYEQSESGTQRAT